MRLFYLLAMLVCLENTIFSQTFIASPGPVLQKEIQFDQANECFIYFDNLNGDSLQLHWRLVESNLPAEWDADLCDYGSCYIGIPSNGLMSPVVDTIRPYLKLIVQPGAAPGATWIWFRVYEEGNQDNYVDVFYSLHTPGTLGADSPTATSLNAYPNPARHHIFLENRQDTPLLSGIRNANGQLVWQEMIPGNSQERIELGNWPTGWYFLQSGNQVQKILVKP